MTSRLDKFRAELRLCGAEAAIITDEINERYFTSFAFSDGLLLITQSEAYLITDFRYKEEAEKHADSNFSVVVPEPRMGFIKEVLSGSGVSLLGFEGKSMSYSEYSMYRSALETEMVDISGIIASLRCVKDEKELENIAAAQKITDAAFSHMLKTLTPDMTEADVALELEFFMRKNGAERLAFDTIAVSGDASALPHGRCRDVKLKKGFLTMDFGAAVRGYCSDMTRTVAIGKASAEMKKVYSTVLSAQSAALEFLKEGVLCRDADAVARGIINDAGYAGTFGHSLGHGVGMYIHEEPRLSAAAGERRLKRGEVVTVEPGIYLEGRFGCRIEDMVAITEDGILNFTASGKDLIEIF